MMCCSAAVAESRVTLAPAVGINTVHDDNLFFASSSGARDLILRLTPSMALHVESDRLSASGSFEFDDDRYRAHSHLSNRLARQRAALAIQYRLDPRLTLALDGGFTDTDTPSELNVLSGLTAARRRARRFELTPSAHFRVSPRLSAHASLSTNHDWISDGLSVRSQFLNGGIEQRISGRDVLTVDSEFGRYTFGRSQVAMTIPTYVVRGGWRRDLDPLTSVTLSAGPRITNGSLAPEVLLSLSRRVPSGSITVSAGQTQTTVIGLAEPVQVRAADARFTYSPTRKFTAYGGPAIFRNTRHGFEATVYRLELGAHYAATPLAGFDVTYSRSSQRGAIDSLSAAGLSRAVLSVGFTTRWKASEAR